MNVTFGICTTFENVAQLTEVITSIRELKIPNYEILLAGSYGGSIIPFANVRYVLTDGWITKKKNIIANLATHDTLVMCHDYYVFDRGWYTSYINFNNHWGDDWEVCSNPQYLLNGQRHFTDWVVWDSLSYPRYHSLEYHDWSQTRYQYISGGYFLVRKSIMQRFPFNESMMPGSPEDVEWSLRVRDHATIKCNPTAIVRHNKVHRDCK